MNPGNGINIGTRKGKYKGKEKLQRKKEFGTNEGNAATNSLKDKNQLPLLLW